MRGKGENGKKLADKGEKHTKLGHFLSIQKFAQCEEQLNESTTPHFSLFEVLKVNPAVRKTVGCVRSEILMDFLFFTFLIRLSGAEKR